MAEYEWAIRHSQGVTAPTTEQDARNRLPSMIAGHERNWRDKVRPTLLRREVTEWEEVDTDA